MANLIFFSSAFKECSIDLSVGIDLSTSARQDREKLQELLPELMQQLAVLSNISCSISSQINTNFRYLVPDSNGRLAFDSGFDRYSNEIIQKFLVHQAAKINHMDVDFLLSLGDNAIHSSSAKVKVISAEDACYGAIRQDLGWEEVGLRFCN